MRSKYILMIILFVFIILTLKSLHKNRFISYELIENSMLKISKDELSAKQLKKVLDLYNSILNSEKKIYSQNGEDGVIEKLIQIANIKKLNGYYVEFGTQDGRECNTRYLREKYNWKGLLMDGQFANPIINLHREVILFRNILDLLAKYNVPDDIDILSEDTDYNDYYIVEKILTKYHPKILIHEVNQQPGDVCVTVPKEDKLIFWDGSNFHGGSVCAFWCLANRFNYTMIYCEKAGVNCFWLRNDLLEGFLGISHKTVKSILTPNFLYKKPQFVYKSTNKIWSHISC